jgi:hypothetical protein
MENGVNTITTHASWQQLFINVDGLAAVHDSDGKLLGYFSPATSSKAAAYAEAAAHFDPAEMKRRKSSNEREYSTAEVLEHLKSLGK